MAKKSTQKPASPSRSKRSRSYASMAQDILSSPVAREVVAALMVYAAASLIKGQARNGSMTGKFARDLGSAGSFAFGTLGEIGSLSLGQAMDILRSHWPSEDVESDLAEPASRRGSRPARKPRSRSRARPGGSTRTRGSNTDTLPNGVGMN